MSARLAQYGSFWVLSLLTDTGGALYLRGRRLRRFRHRHLAVQFAARRGIRLEQP